MRRTTGALVVMVAAWAGEARADILSLRVEAHGGVAGGTGLGGAAQDEAFSQGARGAAYGGLIGLEVLFVEGSIQHHQFRNGDGLIGTWTQFMVGLDLDFESRAAKRDKDGKPAGEGKQTGFLELGMGLGFGVGTGQQVVLPLDNGEVSDKGFLLEGHFSAGKVLGGGVGVGVTVPISFGYFFKSGFANDEGNQYVAAQGAVLLIVRGKIKLK